MKLYCRLTHEDKVVKIDTSSVVCITDDLFSMSEFDGETYVPLMLTFSDKDGNAKLIKDICDIEVY